MKHKLEKILYEYDDELRVLSGKDAEKWRSAMDDVMFCYHNHGNVFPKFKWGIIKK